MLPWSFNLSTLPRTIFPSLLLLLLHLFYAFITRWTKVRERERDQKNLRVSHVPLAIHNHPFHSLPFLFFILVASSTTASSLEALRRSCVLVVTVAEAC